MVIGNDLLAGNLIMPVLVLPMMLRKLTKEEKDNSMVLLMSARRLWQLMELLGFTVVSTSPVLKSLCTVVFILDCMIPSNRPVLLIGKLQDSFGLGWFITNGAGLASYPIDTIRRRMVMTSEEAVKYKSSLDAFKQILKNEGAKSLFKGAGANILRAIAGVLAGYCVR